MTNEEKAQKIDQAISKLCKKYDCEIGVWLTWDDLLNNIHHLKMNPTLDHLGFTLQIKLKENGTNDTEQAGDTSGADDASGSF